MYIRWNCESGSIDLASIKIPDLSSLYWIYNIYDPALNAATTGNTMQSNALAWWNIFNPIVAPVTTGAATGTGIGTTTGTTGTTTGTGTTFTTTGAGAGTTP
jgi:hypothetical protein